MVLWWLLAVTSSGHQGYHGPCVAAPSARLPGGWMPVRGNSRRLGGSLYRWVVLGLLRRRLHPEAQAHLKGRQGQVSRKSVRLCGPEASPGGTGASPRPRENGRSPDCGEQRCREDSVHGPAAVAISDTPSCKEHDRLPEVEISPGGRRLSASAGQLHEGSASTSKARVCRVRVAPESAGRVTHIRNPVGEASVVDGGKFSDGRVRRRPGPVSPAGGASAGRTCEQAASCDHSFSSVVTTTPRKCKKLPQRTKKGPFPLLNVRELDQGSVQSLVIPKVCQHISAVKRWDSISVLYGIEYLVVRKKVHERLLCILRERRERRLRREARESIASGRKARKHRHKRKRKKKGKAKGEKKKEEKTRKRRNEEVERNETLAASRLEREVCASQVGGDAREGEPKDPTEGEGANEDEGGDAVEGVNAARKPPDGSPSAGSGDSRPSRSPSYHQVTSSEKSSSATYEYLRPKETPTRDLSFGNAPHSVPPGPSSSTKTSQTCAYISDDESASERRRSTLYCCPCFLAFRRKPKKSRKRYGRKGFALALAGG
ncbi:hypothetical protein C7M84_022301 [Penaeus vannamei]|uniref:Uncharacterized protein n=1 Tax=Penaeus vannamei TaxID=6689 RepID=A0A3R7Q2T2_PENVA|nr:hypothetical protein C7M84_022301 [Penaeus vannamei]